jgi:hypothetical protein
VEREVRKFSSFAESDAADRLYYRSLTPEARVDILLEIIASHLESQGEAAEGFARVHRIIELGEG